MTMQLVEHVELASSAASIEITSIPTTAKDLVIYACLKSTANTPTAYGIFNSDTTSANYPQDTLRSDQSGEGSFQQSNYGYLLISPANTTATNAPSSNKIYVHDYNSTGDKSISVEGSNKSSSTTYANYYSSLHYTGTSGITSFKVQSSTGDLAAGSILSIYTIS